MKKKPEVEKSRVRLHFKKSEHVSRENQTRMRTRLSDLKLSENQRDLLTETTAIFSKDRPSVFPPILHNIPFFAWGKCIKNKLNAGGAGILMNPAH
jgi:hypothetical protein